MNREEEDYNEQCTRCGKNVLDVHPEGWMILHLASPTMEAPSNVLVCCYCVLDFGEWLFPSHVRGAEWTHVADQLRAALKGYNPNG